MREKTERVLTVAGCVLWISGLAAFIIGLNMTGSAGTWVSVGGNIAFLIGLTIVGVFWIKRRKDKDKRQEERADADGPET